MIHWVAFDDDTAEALVSRLRRRAAEIQHNAPVDAALRVEGKSVVVLPAPSLGKLLIARFSPRKDAQFPTRPAPRIPVRSVHAATTPAQQQRRTVGSVKKPWWRNIVA